MLCYQKTYVHPTMNSNDEKNREHDGNDFIRIGMDKRLETEEC